MNNFVSSILWKEKMSLVVKNLLKITKSLGSLHKNDDLQSLTKCMRQEDKKDRSTWWGVTLCSQMAAAGVCKFVFYVEVTQKVVQADGDLWKETALPCDQDILFHFVPTVLFLRWWTGISLGDILPLMALVRLLAEDQWVESERLGYFSERE